MSGEQDEKFDDLLQRAIAATRQLPEGSGPSPAMLSRTSTALRAAAQRPKVSLLQRITHMSWTLKASAVFAITASILVSFLFLSNPTGHSLAFAEVAEALNNVRSATWKSASTVKTPKNETTTIHSVGMFLAPLHERTETTTGVEGANSIQIIDGEKDKLVTLVAATKTATIINVKNIPEGAHIYGRTFQSLRDLVAEAQAGKAGKVERLPDENIDGRPTVGYRLQLQAVEAKIWADPKTLLPIRVEYQLTSPGGTEVHIVMTDFHTDVDLDAALFSLDLPEGYTLQQTTELDMGKKPIVWVAELLKMVAEQNGDVFPPTLHQEDIGDIIQRFAKAWAEKHSIDSAEERAKQVAEYMKQMTDENMHLSFVLGMMNAMPSKYWEYAGKGVKLNTPDTPIFWLRFPPTSKMCQVIYADLSVKEVPPEQLPKMPQSNGDARP